MDRPKMKYSVASGRAAENVRSIRVFSMRDRFRVPVDPGISGSFANEYT